ncbi:MAG: carbamoyltransferase HypF [Desulfomonilaceae bacterium]
MRGETTPDGQINALEPAQRGVVRRRIELTGILQGIGCRPTVYRIASALGLAGWVKNTTQGVIIEIEGVAACCDEFSAQLARLLPAPGRIDAMTEYETAAVGEKDFQILPSSQGQRSITPIPPDVAVCPECVKELFDPANRRYLYPFITCTLCGPRFTVARSFPYDRETTSMADFKMCEDCLAEYVSPTDRRFHSQTNSCPHCGPRLQLTDAKGVPMPGDPAAAAIELLRDGKIVAVKGLGGFHLACDAHNESAVKELRNRKGREEKPFAVMMPDLATVGQYCAVSQDEEDILCSPIAPIVLLPAKGIMLAPSVAPHVKTLGVMLPYTPLHHLLFRHPHVPEADRPRVLVMTSGNRSEEPIAADNDEALERLGDLVDAFLMHNRDIVLRADDSIVRVIHGRPTVFRRSRGFVPREFSVDPRAAVDAQHAPRREYQPARGETSQGAWPVILGAGGDLKNCPVVLVGDRVVPGPHVGDLASPSGYDYFRRSIQTLTDYLEAQPTLVAVDPHPEYHSSQLAQEGQEAIEYVYHHHAHCVSLLAEHKRFEPALFAVFDGTGYGPDATIWGGEFLLADAKGFERLGHLSRFPLPGGEAAIRDPLRILAALLAEDGQIPTLFLPFFDGRLAECALWLEAVKKGINSPITSSAGRLFDAVAAAAGFRGRVTFEGEAALWLEGLCDPNEEGYYETRLVEDYPAQIDCRSLVRAAAFDILSGAPPEIVAAKFHNSLAHAVADAMTRLSQRAGLRTVGLTGGCFQNKVLTEKTTDLLLEKKFTVLLHALVPPNDGGIAVGQAVAAMQRRA